MVEVLSTATAHEHFAEWECPGDPRYEPEGRRFEDKINSARDEYEGKLSALFLKAHQELLAFAFAEYFGKLRVELYNTADMCFVISTTSDCFNGLEPKSMSLKQIILDTAADFDNSEEVVASLATGLRALARELERLLRVRIWDHRGAQKQNGPGTSPQQPELTRR